MELFLPRRPSSVDSTIGDLFINGLRVCYTLEDVVREVPGEPVSSWKVHGETAIPAGRYSVTLEDSPKFGPETLTVNDVVGFSGIRIHSGNTAEDTEGCIIVGDKIGDNWIGGGTADGVLAAIKRKVYVALGARDECWITITNP